RRRDLSSVHSLPRQPTQRLLPICDFERAHAEPARCSGRGPRSAVAFNSEMKTTNRFQLVLVTGPNQKTARRLARAALNAKLVACANIIPKVESHYWWQGKIEIGAEVLILFKTMERKLPALERLILLNHPYDMPEIIGIRITRGNQR